ncbi:hypothetical protein ACHAXR_005863 [Thalassiosira sp. AJA248-18]
MGCNSPWVQMWAQVENEISALKMESMKYSARNAKSLQVRTDAILAKDWGRGDEFEDKHLKYRAKKSVMDALEKHSDKQLEKAEYILGGIITDLKKEGLNEDQLLTLETKKKIKVALSMVDSAVSFFGSLGNHISNEMTRLLTGFCAITAPQLDPSTNELVSKRLSHVKETIEAFFRLQVPISPNKKDTAKRRHPLFPSQYQVKQAMNRYETMDELWAKFKKEHQDMATKYGDAKRPHTCPRILRDYAPWEMRKADDSSCLCIECEGMNALSRGVTGACVVIDAITKRVESTNVINASTARDLNSLKDIRDIISMPSKYDKVVACLKSCLPTGRLEDAKYSCLNGRDCQMCGFRRKWSNGLKKTLFSYEVAPDIGEERATLNANASLAAPEWSESSIDWRHYTYQAKPSVASHAQDVARQAASARAASKENIDADDEEYNPSATTTGNRNLILATTRGTLIDFLDEFESKSEKHAFHRNLVATERRAQVEWERNVRPLICSRSTGFVSIASWLLAAEWNKTSGKLKVGDEVTVFGELVGEKVNENSFWGKVTRIIDEDKELYEITDKNGNEHNPKRSDLRHRQRHSVACGHVTDDKSHDRYAMQTFTTRELIWLEEYMLTHENGRFQADIPDGKIVRLHQHSDNAGQHFKNTGAINYFTTLINDRGGPSKTAYIYSFGAPGHGKGPYDGIGGRWKHKIDQVIASSMASVIIENPVHRYQFFLYTHDNNPIERPDEAFSTLKGISKQYQFAVSNEGVLYNRQRSCFCLPCMNDVTTIGGTLGWGQKSHEVLRCAAAAAGSNSCEEPTDNVYTFSKSECTKTSGPGVTMAIANETRNRNEVASKLTVGDWVLFDSNEDEQPIWLGRVMANPEWGGQGVLQNKSSSIKKYPGGVEVKKNGVAMNIMWYEKIDIDSDSLDYHVSRTVTEPIVQSNRYYIYGGFEMHRTVGASNPVPKLRTSKRSKRTGSTTSNEYARPTLNNQTSDEDWHDTEYGLKWKMDNMVRVKGLSLCNMWKS